MVPSPDGKTLALVTRVLGAATTTLWNLETGALLAQLTGLRLYGENTNRHHAAWSDDGRWLLLASADLARRVPDGTGALVVDHEGGMRVWRIAAER